MLNDLAVKEASQHCSFPIMSTNRQIANNTSKKDLRAEIHAAAHQENNEEKDKLLNFKTKRDLDIKSSCYSNPGFSHLIDCKLLKRALVDKGASKSIAASKNVPPDTLRHKQPSDTLWNANGGKFTALHEVEI